MPEKALSSLVNILWVNNFVCIQVPIRHWIPEGNCSAEGSESLQTQGAVSTLGSSQILVWLRGTESSFPTSLATAPHNLARPGFPSLGGLLIISMKCENHMCYNRDFHFMFLFQTHVWLKCFYRATQSIKAQYVHTAVKINGEKKSSWTCHLMSTIAWEQKD